MRYAVTRIALVLGVVATLPIWIWFPAGVDLAVHLLRGD